MDNKRYIITVATGISDYFKGAPIKKVEFETDDARKAAQIVEFMIEACLEVSVEVVV